VSNAKPTLPTNKTVEEQIVWAVSRAPGCPVRNIRIWTRVPTSGKLRGQTGYVFDAECPTNRDPNKTRRELEADIRHWLPGLNVAVVLTAKRVTP